MAGFGHAARCLPIHWRDCDRSGVNNQDLVKWTDLDTKAGTLMVRRALQRQTWRHGCDDPHACGSKAHKRKPCPKDCTRHARACPPPCPPDCTGHARARPQQKGGGLVITEVKTRAARRVERLALKPAELQLSTRTGGTVNLHGVCDRTGTNGSGGRLETVNLGAADAAMENVLVHWFNAPLVRPLEDIYDDSDHRVHLGRLVATFSGWTITMDRRPDYDEVWKSALNMGSLVMTHTMQIRREDGAAPFTATEVEPVIDALQFGLSFAVGRWAAPALLVGFDHKGHRVWEQWAARHCTPGDPGPLRWWTEMLTGDLIELLERLVQRFSDPDERFSLRFLMASAVHSAAGGFVEQRIMTAFAAIEHLMWKRLVTVGGMSKTKYKAKDFPASEKLTLVLNEAKIRNDIDAGALPSLYREMQKQEEESNRTWPFIACRIRNMIVHPTDYEERLYRSGEESYWRPGC